MNSDDIVDAFDSHYESGIDLIIDQMRGFDSYNKIVGAFLRSFEFKFIKILEIILSPHPKNILCELVKLLIFADNCNAYNFVFVAVFFQCYR